MTKNSKARDLARKLYIQGENTDSISQQCETSRRTIQRWIKDFEQELVTIKSKPETTFIDELQDKVVAEAPSDDVEVSANVAEILPQLEKVASLKNGDELDLTLSSKMALHLINLSEKSLATLDACLTDPDVRTVDKLKAVQLIGEWVGLKEGNVLRQILGKFDLADEDVDTEKATITLVSRRLSEARKIKKKAIAEYTEQLYGDFVEKDYYFPEFIEKEYFDIKSFLELLQYSDVEEEGYDFLKKGIGTLCELGFQNELRQLGHDV